MMSVEAAEPGYVARLLGSRSRPASGPRSENLQLTAVTCCFQNIRGKTIFCNIKYDPLARKQVIHPMTSE